MHKQFFKERANATYQKQFFGKVLLFTSDIKMYKTIKKGDSAQKKKHLKHLYTIYYIFLRHFVFLKCITIFYFF